MAFVLPVILLFVMGYAINLDADRCGSGCSWMTGARGGALEQTLRPPALRGPPRRLPGGPGHSMAQGEIRGIVVDPDDFSSS